MGTSPSTMILLDMPKWRRRTAWCAGSSRWMELCMSSLGGNSGNLPAGPVAGVCWIGLLVMAFLARGGTDEVCDHCRASGQMGGGPKPESTEGMQPWR